jgi:hypothetical protein
MLDADGKGLDIRLGIVLPVFSILNAACSAGFMNAGDGEHRPARRANQALRHRLGPRRVADNPELHSPDAGPDGYDQRTPGRCRRG